MPSLPTDNQNTNAGATNSNFNSNRIIKTIQIDNQGHYNIVNGTSSGGSSDGSDSDSTGDGELHSFVAFDGDYLFLQHVINMNRISNLMATALNMDLDTLYSNYGLARLPSTVDTEDAVAAFEQLSMEFIIGIAINPLNSVSLSDYPSTKTVYFATLANDIQSTANEFHLINTESLLNVMNGNIEMDGNVVFNASGGQDLLLYNGQMYFVKPIMTYHNDGRSTDLINYSLNLDELANDGVISEIVETDTNTGNTYGHYELDLSIILIMPNQGTMTETSVELLILPEVIHVRTPAIQISGSDDNMTE